MGGSFAASIVTFIWTHRGSIHHTRLTENITAYNPTAIQALNMFGPDQHVKALIYINHIITRQELQISFNEVFYGLGWIFLALIAVTWLARPPFIRG